MSVANVAPLVGAWIEIPLTGFVNGGLYVAPLVGAWIEIIDWLSFTVLDKSLLL